MKFLVICAFVIATVAQTQAGIINAGLGHGLIGTRATIAAAPAAAVAAPLPAAPAPVAATLAAAGVPHLPSLPALSALASLSALPALTALPAPTITIGAPLSALAANSIGARALLGAHGAPLVLPALAAPLHGGLFAGHALPAHL